eukprot:COSAG02_NODE_1032_length_15073_cov_6.097970_2_plen_125_part_00
MASRSRSCDGGAPAAAPPHLSACSGTWKQIKAKLDSLATFVEAHPKMKLAVIPHAGTGAFRSVGAAAQSELNDRLLVLDPFHDIGDYEQQRARPIYDVCNYTCMYALAGLDPGRQQLQMLHEDE